MDNKITFNCLQTKTTSFTRGGTRYIKSLEVLFVTHRKGLWSQIKARATPKLVSFRGLGDQFITTFWFGCSPPQGPLTQGSNEDLNKTKFKISLVLFLRLILQLSNCNVFMKWFSSSRLQTTCLPSSTKHLSYHLNLRRLPGFHQCLYKGQLLLWSPPLLVHELSFDKSFLEVSRRVKWLQRDVSMLILKGPVHTTRKKMLKRQLYFYG